MFRAGSAGRRKKMADRERAVLATRNAGKVRELAGPLAGLGLDLAGLSDFPEIGDIEETGSTFAENAFAKASFTAAATGLVAIADDSGLEVAALGGLPGVHSARYAEDLPFLPGESRDARNIRKLLAALGDLPEEERKARFVCCMTAVRPGEEDPARALRVFGVWEGRITLSPAGENGFGYDPVFFDPELGRTAALMSREEKMARSHRGRAVQLLLSRWAAWHRG